MTIKWMVTYHPITSFILQSTKNVILFIKLNEQTDKVLECNSFIAANESLYHRFPTHQTDSSLCHRDEESRKMPHSFIL